MFTVNVFLKIVYIISNMPKSKTDPKSKTVFHQSVFGRRVLESGYESSEKLTSIHILIHIRFKYITTYLSKYGIIPKNFTLAFTSLIHFNSSKTQKLWGIYWVIRTVLWSKSAIPIHLLRSMYVCFFPFVINRSVQL